MPNSALDIQKKYSGKIDFLDLELLIAHCLKKTREFVLAHPEHILTKIQAEKVESYAKRRLQHEPVAYILGSKEFFGLPFLVSPATLIPRPETELLIEMALAEVESLKSKVESIIDIGTGSGNIIISLAKNLDNHIFYGIDISKDALRVAKRNAKKNNVATKIKFLHGNLLEPFVRNSKLETLPTGRQVRNSKMIILANLPYLSREIYNATLPNVKKFEPKSALYSDKEGLAHYEELFQQMKSLLSDHDLSITVFVEISPEQKTTLQKLVREYFPKAKIIFKKDLARKWRLAIIKI